GGARPFPTRRSSDLEAQGSAPLVLEDGLLYLRRYREYERRLAAGLQRLGRGAVEPDGIDALAPLFARLFPQAAGGGDHQARAAADRKSTRLNSSHVK